MLIFSFGVCAGNSLNLLENAGGSGIPRFERPEFLRMLDTNRFDVIDWEGDGDWDIITGEFNGAFNVSLTLICYILGFKKYICGRLTIIGDLLFLIHQSNLYQRHKILFFIILLLLWCGLAKW